MLGIGWSEMLVIGVIALIVVGPKDLPVMLRNLGRIMGTVRRMGDEFRREIDKAVAAEEFREAKKAISDPLRQTTEEIRKEFNAISKDGKPVPSGKIMPSQPGKESVVDEIRAQAGIAPATASKSASAAKEPVSTGEGTRPSTTASPKAAAKPVTAKKPAAKKATPKTGQTTNAVAGDAVAPKRKAPARKKASKPAASAKDS